MGTIAENDSDLKGLSRPSGDRHFLTLLVVLATWSAANILIRLFAGPTLAFDDGKVNVFTQSFQWGYLPDNPPLYEWMLSLVTALVGPNLAAFLFVKYALCIVSGIFIYFAAKRVLGDPKWASLTVFSLVAYFQFGWNYHQAFTHSIVLIASSCAALWAFTRVIQERRWLDYIVFGVVCGLGLLSKYNFAGLFAALLIAALFQLETRRRVLSLKMLIAVLMALAFAIPNSVYVFQHREMYDFYMTAKLGITGTHSERVLAGIGALVVAFISFYVPALLVFAAVSRGIFVRRVAYSYRADAALICMFGHTVPITMALMVVGVVALGIGNVSERYVIPLLLPSVVWIAARLQAIDARNPLQRILFWAFAIIAALILAIRFAILAIASEGLCETCSRWVPFNDLGTALNQLEVAPNASFVAYHIDTAGNLRRMFPQARVRGLTVPFYRPPRGDDHADACYFVWSEDLTGAPLVGAFEWAKTDPDTQRISAAWTHPFKADWKTTEWGITPVARDSVFYRDYCR